MRVGDLMSSPVVTCREGDRLGAIADLMAAHDCGALPVVDDLGAIIGVITDRDIALAAAATRRNLDEILVVEVARGDVFAVAPGDSLKAAATMMREHQVRRLPVVGEDDFVLGMISLSDLAREVRRQRRRKRKAINSDDLAEALAGICEPSSLATKERRQVIERRV